MSGTIGQSDAGVLSDTDYTMEGGFWNESRTIDTSTPTPTATETPTETPANSATPTRTPTLTETPTPTITPSIALGSVQGLMTLFGSGDALRGVTVSILDRQDTSDSTGFYLLQNVPQGEQLLTAGRIGLEPYSATVNVSNLTTHNIAMSLPSTATPTTTPSATISPSFTPTQTNTATPTPTTISGDTDGDGRINMNDIFFFSLWWYDQENEENKRCNPVADASEDRINENDLLFLIGKWK